VKSRQQEKSAVFPQNYFAAGEFWRRPVGGGAFVNVLFVVQSGLRYTHMQHECVLSRNAESRGLMGSYPCVRCQAAKREESAPRKFPCAIANLISKILFLQKCYFLTQESRNCRYYLFYLILKCKSNYIV